MNLAKIEQLGERIYFTVDDVVSVLGVSRASAIVTCSRYIKNGLFVRVKNDFYLLKRNFTKLSQGELLRLANFIQTPSYVSFLTALAYHEVTTQVTRSLCESACIKRSLRLEVAGKAFNFYRLKKELYFNFKKTDDVFVATAEKALVDSLYLMSLGKYSLDLDALDMEKIDANKLRRIIKIFPAKTGELAKKICKI